MAPFDLLLNLLRLRSLLLFHYFFGLLFKLLLLLLLFLEYGLLGVSLLLLCLLIILERLLSFKSILTYLFLVSIDVLELSSKVTDDADHLFFYVGCQTLLGTIGKVSGDLAYNTDINIRIGIILIELVN